MLDSLSQKGRDTGFAYSTESINKSEAVSVSQCLKSIRILDFPNALQFYSRKSSNIVPTKVTVSDL